MPLKDAFRVETTGMDFLKDYADILKSSQFMTVIAGSMRQGAKPVKAAMKARVKAALTKDSTGATYASIDYRVRRYPKSLTVVGIVGAKSRYKKPTGRMKRNKEGELEPEYRRPMKYAHLLEYGHDIVRGGRRMRVVWKYRKSTGEFYQATIKGSRSPRVVGHVKPHEYVEPALQTSRSSYASVMNQELPARANDAARKAAAKSQRKKQIA